MPQGQPGLTKSQRRAECRVTSGRQFVCTNMQKCEAAHWPPCRVQGTHLYMCSYIGESIAFGRRQLSGEQRKAPPKEHMYSTGKRQR